MLAHGPKLSDLLVLLDLSSPLWRRNHDKIRGWATF